MLPSINFIFAFRSNFTQKCKRFFIVCQMT